ncbi:hypothetical protein, conserved [Eimeria acervulina]|uniref:Uncharacterized protein n=1 Tax=Eimeria acervulina TaxID=5801 RepID=U6GH61_EIMAC|nr:hypothetical protein, conserved [Eimeria acervulina]CDI79571.1 hypothetical protein, conserved [Eimeria acervulina]
MSVPPPLSALNSGKKAQGPPGLKGGPLNPPKKLPLLRAPKLPPAPPSAAAGKRPLPLPLQRGPPPAAAAKAAPDEEAVSVSESTEQGLPSRTEESPKDASECSSGSPQRTLSGSRLTGDGGPPSRGPSGSVEQPSSVTEEQSSPVDESQHDGAPSSDRQQQQQSKEAPGASNSTPPLKTSEEAELSSPVSRVSSPEAEDEKQKSAKGTQAECAVVSGKGAPKARGPSRPNTGAVAAQSGDNKEVKKGSLHVPAEAQLPPADAPSKDLGSPQVPQAQHLKGVSNGGPSQVPLPSHVLQQIETDSHDRPSPDPYSSLIRQMFSRSWEALEAPTAPLGSPGGPPFQYTVAGGALASTWCTCSGTLAGGSIPGGSCCCACCTPSCMHAAGGFLPQQQQLVQQHQQQRLLLPLDGVPLGLSVTPHLGAPQSDLQPQQQQELKNQGQQQQRQPLTAINFDFDLIPAEATGEIDESEESDLEGLDHRWGMVSGDSRWAKVTSETRLNPPPPLVSPRYFSLSGGNRLGVAGPSYRSLYTRPRRYKMGNTYCKHYQLPTVSALLRAGMPEFLRKRPIKIMREGSCKFLHANATLPLSVQQAQTSTEQGEGAPHAAAAAAAAQISAGQPQEQQSPTQDNLPPSLTQSWQQRGVCQHEGSEYLGHPVYGPPHLHPLVATAPSYPCFFMGGPQQAGVSLPPHAHMGASISQIHGGPSIWQPGQPVLGGPHMGSPPPSGGPPGVYWSGHAGAPTGWIGPPGSSNTGCFFASTQPCAAVQQQMHGGPCREGPFHCRGSSCADSSFVLSQKEKAAKTAKGHPGYPTTTKDGECKQQSGGKGPSVAEAAAAQNDGEVPAAAGSPAANGSSKTPTGATQTAAASQNSKGEKSSSREHTGADGKALGRSCRSLLSRGKSKGEVHNYLRHLSKAI